jgi:hypothetical protein
VCGVPPISGGSHAGRFTWEVTVAFGGHSKQAGRDFALTELLFSWFLSRPESEKLLEQTLQQTTSLPEGLSPTHLGKWVFEALNPGKTYSYELDKNGWLRTALEFVRKESFGAFAYENAEFRTTNLKPLYKQLGDRVKASAWYAKEGKDLRKRYRDTLVVAQVQAS